MLEGPTGSEHIRMAAQDDVPALHALVEAAYRGDTARRGWTHEADLLGGQRTDTEKLEEQVAAPGSAILMAESGGRVLGCVHVEAKPGALAYLGLLSVHPDVQASGLGGRLITAAEHYAEQTFGAGTMEMTVIRRRPELIAYYERRGYRRTGEERPFPLDDLRFGIPTTRDLAFVVLAKGIGSALSYNRERAS
jgi:N-acetylglutamate synthase-like GNAT family acetyltransferase